jgi:hypothetical protein
VAVSSVSTVLPCRCAIPMSAADTGRREMPRSSADGTHVRRVRRRRARTGMVVVVTAPPTVRPCPTQGARAAQVGPGIPPDRRRSGVSTASDSAPDGADGRGDDARVQAVEARAGGLTRLVQPDDRTGVPDRGGRLARRPRPDEQYRGQLREKIVDKPVDQAGQVDTVHRLDITNITRA